MHVCFCYVWFSFSVPSQEIGYEERLWNYLYYVVWDLNSIKSASLLRTYFFGWALVAWFVVSCHRQQLNSTGCCYDAANYVQTSTSGSVLQLCCLEMAGQMTLANCTTSRYSVSIANTVSYPRRLHYDLLAVLILVCFIEVLIVNHFEVDRHLCILYFWKKLPFCMWTRVIWSLFHSVLARKKDLWGWISHRKRHIFDTPDALPVAQPTVSGNFRRNY